MPPALALLILFAAGLVLGALLGELYKVKKND